MGRIIHHQKQTPGELVNNSRSAAATDCRKGSCEKNSVLKNSAREFRFFLVHVRTSILGPTECSASMGWIAIRAQNRARIPAVWRGILKILAGDGRAGESKE